MRSRKLFATATTTTAREPINTLLDGYLQKARSQSRVIDRVIDQYGHASIRDYTHDILKSPPSSLQSRDDFFNVVQCLADEVLDADIAQALAVDLKANPSVLTANHHGVDYFAQSAQGSLVFALARKAQDKSVKTALILSCGNIPLDNITYPQGILLYGLLGEHIDQAPRKIPVLSNKFRRWAVSVSPGFNGDMVKRAAKVVTRLHQEKVLAAETHQCLQRFLAQDYGDSSICDLPFYSDQATLLNERLWKNQLPDDSTIPHLVYLELEKVVTKLMMADIENECSLIWQVLFNSHLRQQVLGALEGHRVCWQGLSSLHRNTEANLDNKKAKWGTHFFWGISKDGRKFALTMENSDDKGSVICGHDSSGNRVSYPYNPESITSLLADNKLLPSVFTCFLTLSFARGINCLGGYYQAAYLPDMQAGLVRALEKVSYNQEDIQKIRQIPTDGYLSGMQTVMTMTVDKQLFPAGPIEIMAGGGLSLDEIDKIMSMEVKDAHLASMLDTIPDIAPGEIKSSRWKHLIARDCFDSLGDKVIVK